MDIAQALKALADDSRLRIIHLLSRGSFNVQELTQALELSQSTISHHLKILERAGLVSVRKEGTWSFYYLTSFDNEEEQDDDSFERELLGLTLSAVTRTEKLSDQLQKDRSELDRVLAERRDKAKAYFDNIARSWNTVREEAQGTNADYLPALKDLVPDDGELLELGCGSGALLKELLPRSGETIAVDYSEAMIREAHETLQQVESRIDLRLGYLEHLPVGDETIDCAVGCMVFHHLAEPRDTLTDTFRVMRKGGKLLIVDLTEHSNELMRDRYADLWLGFKTKDFSKWVADAGFCTPKVTLIGPKKEVFLLETTKQ